MDGKSRRNFAGILLCAAIIASPWAAGAAAPSGIYVLGGQDYLLIERNFLGIPRNGKTSLDPFWEYELGYRDDRLGVRRKLKTAALPPSFRLYDMVSGPEGRARRLLREWQPLFEFAPSHTATGDWDLAWVFLPPAYESFPPDLNALAPEQRRALFTLQQPLPSYLHRLDDPLVMEYFDTVAAAKQKAAPDPNRLFSLASRLRSAHRGDLFAHVLYLDALVRKHDEARLLTEVNETRAAYQSIPLLRPLFVRAQSTLTAWQLSAGGRNAADLAARIFGSQTDLKTALALLPQGLKCDGYARARASVLAGPEDTPNFLASQIGTKVFRTWASFLMLQGRRDEALQDLAATYRIAQCMGQSGTLIQRLVALAARNIASKGLELYALNCPETDQEFADCWKVLEQLNASERPLSREEIFSEESIFSQPTYSAPAATTNFLEAAVRPAVADAKFQTVRAAAAVEHARVRKACFPVSPEDLRDLLPGGLPKDPFGTATLCLKAMPNAMVCYSFGPDRKDDGAAVNYDPTNGAVSRGDIMVEIPRRRRYPFPRQGVRAATPADLLRQMPNGLPEDVFADTRGRALSISAGPPVVIYSFGPDTDERNYRRRQPGQQGAAPYGMYGVPPAMDPRNATPRPTSDKPTVLYDPTNGTNSYGDLFFEVPR